MTDQVTSALLRKIFFNYDADDDMHTAIGIAKSTAVMVAAEQSAMMHATLVADLWRNITPADE